MRRGLVIGLVAGTILLLLAAGTAYFLPRHVAEKLDAYEDGQDCRSVWMTRKGYAWPTFYAVRSGPSRQEVLQAFAVVDQAVRNTERMEVRGRGTLPPPSPLAPKRPLEPMRVPAEPPPSTPETERVAAYWSWSHWDWVWFEESEPM